MVMKMKYRIPRSSVIDRHILIELDNDYEDNEMIHLLKKAYENNKAPHEYDDIKKHIKDIIIGKHNSIYIEQDGQPNQVSASTVLAPIYINSLSELPLDSFDYGHCNFTYAFQSGCNSAPYPRPNTAYIWSYNNGNAPGWTPFYTTEPFSSQPSLYTTSPPQTLTITPSGALFCSGSNNVTDTALYAAYITGTNPIILSTYHYWTLPTTASAQSYSYVYFTLMLIISSSSTVMGVPLFYSLGSYNFSPGVSYISLWQFLYD